jgi:RimJ/RimL family protein N-acetyltransferase
MCGFVRRDTLPGPDIGFSFLPEHERRGYGYESASAILDHGRRTLGFSDVYAITTLDNEASGRLLERLGFSYDRNIETENEILRLFTLVL